MVLAKGDKPKGWGLMRNSNAWRTTSSRLALLASSSVFGLTAVAGGPMARADEPGLPPPKTYAVSGLRGPVDYSFQGIGGGNGVYISPNGGSAGYGPQLTVNFDGAGIFGQIAAPTVSIASQGGNGGSGYTFEVANPGGNGGNGGGGGDITITLDSLTSVISSSTDIGAAFTVSSPGGAGGPSGDGSDHNAAGNPGNGGNGGQIALTLASGATIKSEAAPAGGNPGVPGLFLFSGGGAGGASGYSEGGNKVNGGTGGNGGMIVLQLNGSIYSTGSGIVASAPGGDGGTGSETDGTHWRRWR